MTKVNFEVDESHFDMLEEEQRKSTNEEVDEPNLSIRENELVLQRVKSSRMVLHFIRLGS